MSAALRLPPVTWTLSATILLAHTAVLAVLGTLVTAKHAQVRELRRILRIENTEYQLKFGVRSLIYLFIFITTIIFFDVFCPSPNLETET